MDLFWNNPMSSGTFTLTINKIVSISTEIHLHARSSAMPGKSGR